MPAAISSALQRFFSGAAYPIIFTGAGVSVRAGLPTWKDLVVQLAEGIRAFDPLSTAQMLEAAKTGNYPLAVDYFWLSPKVVDGEKQNLLVRLLSEYDTHQILPVAGLPFRGCLTTNFDRSLLDAIAITRQQSARDYKLGDSSFKQAQWQEGLFVARIHGTVEAPDSIVLSQTKFKSLLEDETYADLLRTCFVHRNVLFLGFSFYDPAVRHVFEDLNRRFGSASPGRHLALLPQDASNEFMQKAGRLNIEVVQYDPKNDHAALWDGISLFSSETRGSPAATGTSRTTPFDFTKRYLAACYARAASRGRSAPLREAVVEGIVSAILQEVSPKAISRRDLLERIRLTLGLKGKDAEAIAQAAVKSLIEAGLCRKLRGQGEHGFKLAWIGEPSQRDSLETAIRALSDSGRSRAYLQEGWKVGQDVLDAICSFFGHLIRRRGWDLGAAFASGRAPDSVAFEGLLNEAAASLPAFDRERLLRVCTSMLQHPSQEEADLLGELGRVSFAVELAFQSPSSTLLHDAILPRRIYFDASVLLPAFVEGHPFGDVYRPAIGKLKKAASEAAIELQLKVCTVYLNEMISHRRNAVEYKRHLGDDFPAVARRDALYHGVPNTNVYVGAYANWVENNAQISFDDFLSRFAPYTTERELQEWLVTQGLEVVASVKGPKFPLLYARLERAYSAPLSYGKTPILIEHDAIQLSMLDVDASKQEKAMFVTADRQLQVATSEGGFSNVADAMISHVGLIQLIELLLGGIVGGTGLAELLWSSRISNRAQAVRSYFTSLGLAQYDNALAMTMPSIVEKLADSAAAELERVGADLDVEDPRKRADAFRTLGSLEKNYLAAMQEAVAKLRREQEATVEEKPEVRPGRPGRRPGRRKSAS